ncbi:MAG TPA: hypothetical protein VMV18_10965, partial [bacterium]|nr:hypothetical protein [bacterium]
ESELNRSKVFVVDDSWKRATGAEQESAVTEMAARAAKEGFLEALVQTAAGEHLETKPAAAGAATPAGSAAETPTATPTPSN